VDRGSGQAHEPGAGSAHPLSDRLHRGALPGVIRPIHPDPWSAVNTGLASLARVAGSALIVAWCLALAFAPANALTDDPRPDDGSIAVAHMFEPVTLAVDLRPVIRRAEFD